MNIARQELKKAHTVYIAGDKSASKRVIKKFISSTLRLGIASLVIAGTWHGVGIGNKINNLKTSNTNEIPPIGTRALAGSLPGFLNEDKTNEKPDFSNIAEGGVPKADFSNVTGGVNVLNPQPSLPIEVVEGDTISSLTVKMYNEGYYFHSLALQMEGLETEPYYIEGDSSQPTIGVGYNVKMGLDNIGREGVEREMRDAGIEQGMIDKLTNPDKNISSTAFISVQQALALLDVTYERFENSTKSALGDSYDKLPDHRKAALVWLDYNSNIHTRPKLIRAVKQDNVLGVMREMDTTITVNGVRQESPKVPVIRHLYHNQNNMYETIMNPSLIKRKADQGLLAWQKSESDKNQSVDINENENNVDLNEQTNHNLPFQSQSNLRQMLLERREAERVENQNKPRNGNKLR